MKKTLLTFITICAVCTNSIAQENIIWSEDFANGIPNNWINEEVNGATWEYRGATTTPNNTIGSRGACTNNFAGEPINSTSKNNGFIIFDSNYWDNDSLPCSPANFGSGPVPGPHLAKLTTSSIDLSSVQFAVIELEQYIRFYQGTTRIEVSINQGNWSLLYNNDVPLASSTTNPQKKRIYLGLNIVGNNDVRFRFVYEGLYYFWMIDDIAIKEIDANDLKFNSTTYGDFDFLDPAHPTGFEWMEYSIYPSSMSPTLKFSANVENWGGLPQTGCGLQARVTKDIDQSTLYSGTTTDLVTLPVGNDAELRAGQFTMPQDTGNYTIYYQTFQNEIDENLINHFDTAHFRISPCVLARDHGKVNSLFESNEVFWDNLFELGNVFLPTFNMPVSAISVALGSNADLNASLKGRIHSFQYGDSLVTSLIAETPLFGVDGSLLNAQGDAAKFQYLSFGSDVTLQANTPYLITIESSAGINHLPVAMSHPADLYTSWIKNIDGYFYLERIPLIRIQSCMDTGNANPDTTTFVSEPHLNNWNVYPNPVKDFIQVQGLNNASNANLTISDISGRVIMHTTYHPSNAINVSDLKSGFYQITVVSENKRKTRSFVKE